MISLIYILYSLIFICEITNVHSQGTTKDILGPSACDLYVMNNADCGTLDLPVGILPKECSSYLYMYLKAENGTVIDMGEKHSTVKGYLDQLIKTNISVLVHLYHGGQKEWCEAVKNVAAGQTTEIDQLKSLLDKHPGVKGIILGRLLDPEVTLADCPDYTQNVKAYIDLVHKTFPKFSVGITIITPWAKEMYNNPEKPWMDYKCLDPSVDFYVATLKDLNKCTDDFTKTGTYPLSGNSNNTVDAMKAFLDEAGVPSSKLHYVFYNYGIPKGTNPFCNSYSNTYCKNVQELKTSICADTLQTLFEKGAFAKKNGVGFVVNSIDSDDYDCTCKCGQSYPGFKAILSGYNGGPPPPPCALFDRT